MRKTPAHVNGTFTRFILDEHINVVHCASISIKLRRTLFIYCSRELEEDAITLLQIISRKVIMSCLMEPLSRTAPATP